MGFGFRLNLKWGFPVHSNSLKNSPSSRILSSSVRSWEISSNSPKLSFLSIICEEGETNQKDCFRVNASAPLTTLDNDHNGKEEVTTSTTSREKTGSCFSLLMNNLEDLEKTFADSDVLRLEKDILRQLGLLGARKFFDSCLSRSLEPYNILDLSNVAIKHTLECDKNSVTCSFSEKLVVRSWKKEERRSRRNKVLKSETTVYNRTLSKDTVQQLSSSSRKRTSNSKTKQSMVARSEAEMSEGVKVVAELDRIRNRIEEQTGKVASLSSWAEAAGVDEKVLQQKLRFGWFCRDELIRSTRPLVLYLTRRYRGSGIAVDDLLQAGNLGVLQGAERFDHTRGHKFSTYIQYWIRKYMSRATAQHARGIQLPYALNRSINQINKARKFLSYSYRKHPNDLEIAAHTGLSLARVEAASKCLKIVGSLDNKKSDLNGAKYMESIPDTSIRSPGELVLTEHMKKDVHVLLKGLDSRERLVMELRYGFRDYEPRSLEEIGKIFKVSREWIRQMEKKAMQKLRNHGSCKNMEYYLHS